MMKHKIFRIVLAVLFLSIISIDEAKAIWYGARVNATVVERTGDSVYGGKVMVSNYNGDQEYAYNSAGGQYSGNPGGSVNITMNAKADDGYSFSGWFSSSDASTPESTQTPYTKSYATTTTGYEAKDYYIFAKFSPVSYTLHYDLNGGVTDGTIADEDYTIESVFNLLPSYNFTKIGYSFTGWKPTSNSGNWRTTDSFADEATISGKYGDVTLQAQWELKTYTIYYDANGGSVSSDTQEYTINSTDALLTPTRDGYTFAGWEIWENDPDDGNWEFGEIADSPLDHKFGDVGLKAIWTLNNYTISYAAGDHSTGGSTSATTYVIENGFNLKSNGFTPEAGWVFDKWKVTTAGSGSDGNWTLNSTYDEGQSIAAGKFGNVTMTALWKESPLADITIIVTGLEEGESAIFTVAKVDSATPICTVSITGNSSGTSSATIKSQQTGFQYQVRPINAWTWTYTMDPNGGMVIGLGKSGATFEFEATKKSSVKKNDEQVQINWLP